MSKPINPAGWPNLIDTTISGRMSMKIGNFHVEFQGCA